MNLSWFIPLLIFMLVGLTIGARMLVSARRTGGTPEMLFAGFALCLALGVCSVMFVVAIQDRIDAFLAHGLSTLACGIMLGAVTMLYFGAWRFYRPTSRVALAISGLASALGLAAWVDLASRGVLVDPGSGSTTMTASLAILFVGLAWWGAESLVYYGKLRRRTALGLADPIVTDRFRMLGTVSICIATVVAITALSPILQGIPGRDDPFFGPAMLVLWLIVCVCGTCAWISPKPYRSYIMRKFASTQSPSPDPTLQSR